MSLEVLRFIEELTRRGSHKETGGILIGFHDGNDIRIIRASDGGPNAKRSKCGFLRDTKFCQAVLDQEHAASGGDYVGEWHTHVVDLPRPSDGDLATLAGIILDPDYGFPSFSMILGIKRAGIVEVRGYVVVETSQGGTALAEQRDVRAVRVAQVTLEVSPL